MYRYLIAAGGGAIILALAAYWIYARGADAERAATVQQINANIDFQRKTDAKFNKMDARQFCINNGLEWVFIDGKSHCE